MTIEKRGKTYRIVKMVDGKRYRANVDHKPTQKEAERIINNVIYNSSTPIISLNSTFEEAVKNYCRNKSQVLSPVTIRNYMIILNNLPDYFQLTMLSDVDNSLIQRCINDYAVNRSAKTVYNAYGLISGVLKEYTTLQPSAKLPMRIKKEPYIPTPDEVKAILAKAKGTRYEVPLMLAIYGLRRSEIYALTLDDLEGNILHINKATVRDSKNKLVLKNTTKTAASTRDIYISDELANLIRQQGYVTIGCPDSLYNFLTAAENELHIEHFSVHKLRHFFASQMSAILPEADVLALGGWSTPNVMKTVYRHNQIMRDKEMQKNASAELMKKLI